MKKFSGSSSKKVISPHSDFIVFIFLFLNYISFHKNSFCIICMILTRGLGEYQRKTSTLSML